jgi:hypothetical protein
LVQIWRGILGSSVLAKKNGVVFLCVTTNWLCTWIEEKMTKKHPLQLSINPKKPNPNLKAFYAYQHINSLTSMGVQAGTKYSNPIAF